MKLLSTFALALLLATPATAQEMSNADWSREGLKKVELTRFVPSGKKQLLWFIHGVNPDCSPKGAFDVKQTKEPEHGTVEIVSAQSFSEFAKDSPFHKCNEHRMNGLMLNYKANGGYVGSDELEVLVIAPGGLAWEVHYNLNVR